jgi:hypothetical protein
MIPLELGKTLMLALFVVLCVALLSACATAPSIDSGQHIGKKAGEGLRVRNNCNHVTEVCRFFT